MKLSRIIAAIALSICFTAVGKDVWENTLIKEKATDANNGIAIITGQGEVLPDDYVVTLFKWGEWPAKTITTDTIINGKFSLEAHVGEDSTIGFLYVNNSMFPSMIHKIYLTPGAMVEIDAVDKYMYTWPVKSNVPEQSEYEQFINKSRDLWIEYQKGKLDYEKYNRSPNGSDYFQWGDSLKLLIKQRDLELLRTLPVGTVWLDEALELAKYYSSLSEDLKVLYENLNESVKDSPKGQEIQNYLYQEPPIALGDKFPDTEFFDIDGNSHRFSEFKGKWCLVDFWSSGCSPCIRAIPELQELKKKYPDTLEVINLSLDTESIWRELSKKLHLSGNNWNERKDGFGIFRRLGLKLKPSFLIVTPDGTIKEIWSGYDTGELKEKTKLCISQVTHY